ncbi:MAG: PAS domain-containing hybrid sensor histidine kinase/response regulator [Acidobacteria bacterium]|nr:MAG: PAS domain-containing hybrid sensor histidine kinase/response regulator [Acidobacteriota bacterium]
MKESTQTSKSFNRGSRAGATLNGHAGFTDRSDTTPQPVSEAFGSGHSDSGDQEASATPGFDMGHFQYAQIAQAVIDQAVLGAAFVDLDSRIQLANRALADLLQYSQEELKGMAVESLLGGPGGAQALLRGTEASHTGHRKPPSVINLKQKSGDIVACLIDSHAIYDENGKTMRFLVFVNPTLPEKESEELNRVENELYRSQGLQTLGILAGGVAHDFNNALEVIIGFSSLARLRLPPADPLHEPLKIIEESAKGAAGLARRLLDASRDNPDDEGPVDTAELVGGAISIITRTFDRKIRIEHRIAPRLPSIKANHSRLQQAILNLCINARDAMQQGGTLLIEADLQTLKLGDGRLAESNSPGHYVRIAVRDTGEGIPPEIVKNIFVPLFTTKGPGRGHGLGLAMVEKMVKDAEGFISVSSTPGQGSDFSLYFPAVFGRRTSAADSRHGQILEGQGQVLVVDDEPRILQFLETGLTRLGYEVLTAESGRKACEIYSSKSDDINCVLIDLIMPGLSGLETYARLKDINPSVKVILSSGYSSGRIRHEAAVTGSSEFLEKPFTLEELSRAMQKVQRN